MRSSPTPRGTVSSMVHSDSFQEFYPIAGRRPVCPSCETKAKPRQRNARVRKIERVTIACRIAEHDDSKQTHGQAVGKGLYSIPVDVRCTRRINDLS
jgi:hypothetical protein